MEDFFRRKQIKLVTRTMTMEMKENEIFKDFFFMESKILELSFFFFFLFCKNYK